MKSHTLSFRFCAAAGVLALLLISSALICGCLRTEPEELLPHPLTQPPATPQLTITVSPAPAVTVTEAVTNVPGPVRIESNGKTSFREMDFPAEVKQAVSDFISGKTTDEVNGFLRWESVRSRTNPSEATRIREQIGSIDYAVFNTALPETIRVYFGISGEQAKRFRNESVFSENGYIIASSDPSVVYNRFTGNGRDRDGYLTLCALDLRRGDHVLPVNATEREYLISRGGIWDFDREDIYEVLVFSSDSVPRYRDEILKKVRIIYTREHP